MVRRGRMLTWRAMRLGLVALHMPPLTIQASFPRLCVRFADHHILKDVHMCRVAQIRGRRDKRKTRPMAGKFVGLLPEASGKSDRAGFKAAGAFLQHSAMSIGRTSGEVFDKAPSILSFHVYPSFQPRHSSLEALYVPDYVIQSLEEALRRRQVTATQALGSIKRERCRLWSSRAVSGSCETPCQRVGNHTLYILVKRQPCMAYVVQWTELLNVEVLHTRFINKRCSRWSDEFVMDRGQDCILNAGLSDSSGVQSNNSRSSDSQVIASSTAHTMQQISNELSRQVAKDVSEIVDAVEISAVGRRRDCKDLVNVRRQVWIELWNIQDL